MNAALGRNLKQERSGRLKSTTHRQFEILTIPIYFHKKARRAINPSSGSRLSKKYFKKYAVRENIWCCECSGSPIKLRYFVRGFFHPFCCYIECLSGWAPVFRKTNLIHDLVSVLPSNNICIHTDCKIQSVFFNFNHASILLFYSHTHTHFLAFKMET